MTAPAKRPQRQSARRCRNPAPHHADLARRAAARRRGKALSAVLGITACPTFLAGAILAQGVKLRESNKARKLTDEEVEEAVATYRDSDLSVNEVARRFGISGPTLLGSVVRRGVEVRKPDLFGERHPNWRGGRSLDTRSGYIRIRVKPSDPAWLRESSSPNGDMLEHRYVMAKHLGRALTKGETVHHINGNKTDNDIENLQLRNGKHGKGVVRVCACCGSTDIKEVPLQ